MKLICPTLTKCYSRCTHSYIHWWTSFSRTKLCPSRCYLTFFHFPERSIALVKRLAGSPKGLKLIPTCTLTKCYSKAHAFLYIDGLLSVAQTVAKPLLSYLFSRTFNCTSKTTGWFTKGLSDPNLPANKSVTQGSTRILIHWWTSFSRTKLCQAVAILPSSIFPERSIALVKRLAGSKELKLIPTCPTLTKVLLQGSTRILIYIDGLLSVAHQTVKPLLSYLLPFSRTFNCTSKTTGWFTKGLKLIPTCPR
jgi:hypothetical protein